MAAHPLYLATAGSMIDEDASAVCLVLFSGVLAIKQLASLVVLVLFSFMG